MVIIYTKANCPYCEKAKGLLKSKGASIEEVRIDLDPQKREDMIKQSKGMQSVPQIFINNQHVGGCDDVYALDKAGKLDDLLKS